MAFVHTWNSTFEGDPEDSDAANELGLRVRNLKEAVRERFDVEHDHPGDGTGVARHKFEIDTNNANMNAITDQVNGMIAARSDLKAIFVRIGGVFVPAMGHLYSSAATRAALGAANMHDGFLGVSSDAKDIFVWDGTAGAWNRIAPGPQWSADDTASGADLTLFANDTREALAGLSEAITIPDDGRSYEVTVTAVVRYGALGNVRLGAVLVEDIDGTPSDVDTHLVRLKDDDLGGVTLVYKNTSCTGGEVHTYTVEACADVKGNITLNPTATSNAFGNYTTGDFSGITSYSRMTVDIRERVTV